MKDAPVTAWIKQLDEFSVNKKKAFFLPVLLFVLAWKETRGHEDALLMAVASWRKEQLIAMQGRTLALPSHCFSSLAVKSGTSGGNRPAAERSITQTTTPSSHTVAQCVSVCACVCLLLCAHVSKSTRVWTFADPDTIAAPLFQDNSSGRTEW